ncbi:hypothetical protein Trydic_g6720 [Trypoxylus dichotomus]
MILSLEGEFGWVTVPSSSESTSRVNHGRGFPWMNSVSSLCIPGLQSVEGCLETTVDYPNIPGSREDAHVVRKHRQIDVRFCWNVAGVNAEQER